MQKIIALSQGRWIVIFSGLSNRNKRSLYSYFKNIYPRDYARKLTAALDGEIQSQNSSDQHKN